MEIIGQIKAVHAAVAESCRDRLSDGDHSHRCDACATEWRHCDVNNMGMSEEQFNDAHRCPQCGKEQFMKLKGSYIVPVDMPVLLFFELLMRGGR